ncbi:MAG: (2E,6E)-farnesyl diphosphate synthase [Enterovibrio sp.]
MNNMQLSEALRYCQQRSEQNLTHWLDTLPNSTLKAAMQHGALLGGKRLRPFLCYATGALFNAALPALDTAAAALECLHAYSLIHDDLPAMDDDNLRRGKPTCHIAFNEATAILAGDALQTLAFTILAEGALDPTAEPHRLSMIKSLAHASGASGMCLGQAQDLEAENKIISQEALEFIHQHKTGALIQSSVELGAYCAGAQALEHIEKLRAFAAAIGLAFQVQDDILDLISDTQTLGKPQGSDLAANKNTYPALLGLTPAKEKAQQLVNDALQILATIPYNTSLLEQFARYIIARQN